MHSLPLNAEVLWHWGEIPITNTVVATWLTMLVLVGIAIATRRAILAGYTGFFGGVALLLESFLGFLEDILGWEYTKQLAPLLGTFFVFILGANWMGLVPGFGALSIGEEGHLLPLLRGATTDINTTLALAVVSVVAIQGWGLAKLGISYMKKYINFSGPWYFTPINVFVGILEIISEFAKILSFAFRLFGNIFAGEVLLSIMLGLVPLVIPMAFYGLELFVGVIQALVFVLLSTVFFKLASEQHEAH